MSDGSIEIDLTGGAAGDNAKPDTVRSVFADLLAKRKRREPVTLPIEGHEHIAVRYSATLPVPRLQEWVKRCTKKGELDPVQLNRLVLINQAEAIIVEGTELTDDGKPLLFGSDQLQEMLDATNAIDALRKLYGGDDYDGDHVITAHALRVQRAAGMHETVEEIEGDDSPS